MTRRIEHRSTDVILQGYGNRIRGLEALFAGASACGDWYSPTLLNGWTWAGDPYSVLSYRKPCPDMIEFMGHIEGGASGSVAFIIEAADRLEKDCDALLPIVIGGTPRVAYVYFAMTTTGEVTITYPVA